jgi:hypothetical protein
VIRIIAAVAILGAGVLGAAVFGVLVKPALDAMSDAEIGAGETRSETLVQIIVQSAQSARDEAPAAGGRALVREELKAVTGGQAAGRRPG